MDKQEWIKRCSARFVERGGCVKEVAIDMAESCFEAAIEWDGFLESPESVADEDMSYWGE